MPPDLVGSFFLTPADAELFLAIPLVLTVAVAAYGKSLFSVAWLDVRLRRDESDPGCV